MEMMPRKQLANAPYSSIARRGARRHGMMLIYVTILLTALFAFVSMGVDLGHVQLVKMQLENAADAAARAGAAQVLYSISQAKTDAIATAAANKADGVSITLSASDIDIGNWSSGTFTVNGTPTNAVWVHLYRTRAKSNPVQLSFGQVIGMSVCDVHASAVAMVTSNYPAGMVGLNSVVSGNNLFVGSYSSTTTSSPSHVTHNNNAIVQSNGTVAYGVNSASSVYGTVNIGPSGSVGANLNVTGGTSNLVGSLSAQEPQMHVVTNPFSLGQSVVAGSGNNVALPGGTYYFTSVNMGGSSAISFTGPTTIYLDGDFIMGAGVSLLPYQNKPTNLTIYQSAGHSFSSGDNTKIVGVYVGPGCNFNTGNSADLEGAFIANKMTVGTSASLYYDENIGSRAVAISLTR